MPSNSPTPTNADDVTVRRGSKAIPCPFCGATPHHGLGKLQHCQLHGEPYQDFSIWCPHKCAKITSSDEIGALRKWNHRIAHQSTGEMESLPYQMVFNAIGDAVKIEAGRHIAISVQAFKESIRTARGDFANAQQSTETRLRAALESIAAEAERENGSWVHLKRCIAVQARAALAIKGE